MAKSLPAFETEVDTFAFHLFNELLREQPEVPPEIAASLTLQVCEGLAEASAQPVTIKHL